MDHVAIDLGKTKSQICQRSADGTIVKEGLVPTAGLEQMMRDWPPSRVVVETCAEAFAVADAAKRGGHQVRVVPATLVRTLGVGARGIKNDRRDARVLSEVSVRIDLPSVHVPQASSREIKALCSMRDGLVQSRTMLINTVRGWLRGRIAHVRSGAASSFAQRVRQHAVAHRLQLPTYVTRQLDSIEQLTTALAQADAELKQTAEQHPVAPRLMSTPGVGPVTALRIVSTFDDVTRFHSAAQVGSYLGLTPGQKQSGAKHHRTGITRAGVPHTRAVLIQAAWSLRRVRPGEPIVRWAAQLELRRGKQVAIVALARKLAGILFALWRDNQTYNPARAARALTHDALLTGT